MEECELYMVYQEGVWCLLAFVPGVMPCKQQYVVSY